MDEETILDDTEVEADIELTDEGPEDADMVLTTIDNPFNPKEEYLKWKQWDEESGYNTESYIARLLMMEPDFDIDDELGSVELTNKVINDILEHDPTNMYALV